MPELFKNIWDSINNLIDPAKPYLPFIIGGGLVLFLVVRFGVAFLIREAARLKDKSSHQHFKAKSVLLAHGGLVELYAPAKLFTTEADDPDKKPWRLAWLSPYPRAVKASYKRNRVPKSERLDAKRQVREAAKFITVSPLPDDMPSMGDLSEHYLISLKLDGKDPDTFRRMTARLVGQLGLVSLEEVDTRDPYGINFIAHETEAKDPLVEQKAGAAFFVENPATKPYSLPLAVKKDGSAWRPSHTPHAHLRHDWLR